MVEQIPLQLHKQGFMPAMAVLAAPLEAGWMPVTLQLSVLLAVHDLVKPLALLLAMVA